MREIKFRRWDENGKRWLDHATTFVSLDGNGVLRVSTDYVGKARYCLLSQYTGLKDKNGKEIYESDILCFGMSMGVIIWENACWLVEWKTHLGRSTLYELINNSAYEVLGNIHENPDLLKGELR